MKTKQKDPIQNDYYARVWRDGHDQWFARIEFQESHGGTGEMNTLRAGSREEAVLWARRKLAEYRQQEEANRLSDQVHDEEVIR